MIPESIIESFNSKGPKGSANIIIKVGDTIQSFYIDDPKDEKAWVQIAKHFNDRI